MPRDAPGSLRRHDGHRLQSGIQRSHCECRKGSDDNLCEDAKDEKDFEVDQFEWVFEDALTPKALEEC